MATNSTQLPRIGRKLFTKRGDEYVCTFHASLMIKNNVRTAIGCTNNILKDGESDVLKLLWGANGTVYLDPNTPKIIASLNDNSITIVCDSIESVDMAVAGVNSWISTVEGDIETIKRIIKRYK